MKFKILERTKREGNFTLEEVANFLQGEIKQGALQKLKLEHPTIKIISGDSDTHMKTINLTFQNKGTPTRNQVFDVAFGGTKKGATGILLKRLIYDFLEDPNTELIFDETPRGDEIKKWVIVDSVEVDKKFAIKTMSGKGAGGIGISGASKTNEREILPILHAYKKLGWLESLQFSDLGIGKKEFQKLIREYDNVLGSYNAAQLISQGERLFEIFKANEDFFIVRGDNKIYTEIRNKGLKFLKKSTRVNLSKVDKYTPADLILVRKTVKPIPKSKETDLFGLNNLFANDLTKSGNIGRVGDKFHYIGISQKQDITAQGGAGKMFFSILNKDLFTIEDPTKSQLQNVDFLREEYNRINEELNSGYNRRFITLNIEQDKYFRSKGNKRGRKSEAELIGKYKALTMLEYLLFEKVKDLGELMEAKTNASRKINPDSFLKLVQYSMCAGVKTNEGQFVHPCFYKIIGGSMPAPYNQEQMTMKISDRETVIITYNKNSIVLEIPLIIIISKGRAKEENPIFIKLPFLITGENVQPLISRITEENKEEEETEEIEMEEKKISAGTKISEILSKIDQFK